MNNKNLFNLKKNDFLIIIIGAGIGGILYHIIKVILFNEKLSIISILTYFTKGVIGILIINAVSSSVTKKSKK